LIEDTKIEIKVYVDAEVSKIKLHFGKLLRDFELEAEVTFRLRVQKIDAYYLQEVEALTVRYTQMIVEIEAEWNLTVRAETERIKREALAAIAAY
jgi:hypothetical protein